MSRDPYFNIMALQGNWHSAKHRLAPALQLVRDEPYRHPHEPSDHRADNHDWNESERHEQNHNHFFNLLAASLGVDCFRFVTAARSI